MTLQERIAEIESVIAAILAGKSGWPNGLWDPAIKRLEATADALTMTDDELAEFSAGHRTVNSMLGLTGASLMIEVARRSTLTAHQRMAEAAERERIREC